MHGFCASTAWFYVMMRAILLLAHTSGWWWRRRVMDVNWLRSVLVVHYGRGRGRRRWWRNRLNHRLVVLRLVVVAAAASRQTNRDKRHKDKRRRTHAPGRPRRLDFRVHVLLLHHWMPTEPYLTAAIASAIVTGVPPRFADISAASMNAMISRVSSGETGATPVLKNLTISFTSG